MNIVNLKWERFKLLVTSIVLAITNSLVLFNFAAFATLGPEIGPWQTSANSLPTTLWSMGTATNNDYVYIVGGYDTSGSSYPSGRSDSVRYAHLNSDGSVGTWQTSSNPLPERMAGHTSLAYGGYVYVFNGERGNSDNDASVSAVLNYAPLNSDGSVGTWQTSVNQTPVGLVLSSATVSLNNFVYIVGGESGAGDVSSIYYTHLPIFDTTAPTITASVSPTPTNGWNKTNATVTFTCTDEVGGSGIQNCTPPMTFTNEGNNFTATGTAVDNAGNTTTIVVPVKIDKTSPTAGGGAVSAGLVFPGGSETFTVNVADPSSPGVIPSGVVRGEYYIDTDPGQGNGAVMNFTAGSTTQLTATKSNITGYGLLSRHTVYMRSLDKAGNWSATTTATFTYF